MRISFNWLKQYIDIPDTAEKVADILTSLGLEVEGIETLGVGPEKLHGVVTGEVKECWKHPGADRLSLTKVDIGTGQLLQIVCGAPNVAAGQKVFVATEGTTLHPKKGDPFTIKKGKIRGEISEGMICAQDELGLSDDHSGIMILDQQTQIGKQAADVLDLNQDSIFEIGLTPNRADATNHIGVAKDLLAWYRVHRKVSQELNWPESIALDKATGNLSLQIEVKNEKACPRYSGICLSGVKVGPSPKWLQDAIIAMGQKPVNNIVDITNYVMFEMGQPLHAFDYDKIDKRKIIVDTLAEGTAFVTLDEVERKLRSEDLMICDGNVKALCIAGVLGGIGSGITEQTSNVFLESAHFNASYIRKSSMAHIIRTQAAKCFEKGSDPNITVQALERAVFLLNKYAQAELSSPLYDVYPNKIEPAEIIIDKQKVIELSGLHLSDDALKHILFSLNCELTDLQNGQYKVWVPTNKPDVTRAADLVEEISRVYGLDHIPVPEKIQLSFPKNLPNDYLQRKKLRDQLVAKGLHEIMNLSLVRSQYCIKSGAFAENDLIFIHNTSNVQLDCMRPSLIFGGLESIQFNQNRQQSDIGFFEFGKTFIRKDSGILEQAFLGLWLSGIKQAKHWSKAKEENQTFYDMKAWVLSCLEGLALKNLKTENLQESSLWSYGLAYYWGDKKIASFGLVSQTMMEMYDLRHEVWYAEIHWDNAMAVNSKAKPFEDMSKFPAVVRDLAFTLNKEIGYDKIEKAVSEAAVLELKSVTLFDIYENAQQLGVDIKSMALSFQLESMERSMTAKELDQMMEKIAAKLEKDLGAQIRR